MVRLGFFLIAIVILAQANSGVLKAQSKDYAQAKPDNSNWKEWFDSRIEVTKKKLRAVKSGKINGTQALERVVKSKSGKWTAEFPDEATRDKRVAAYERYLKRLAGDREALVNKSGVIPELMTASTKRDVKYVALREGVLKERLDVDDAVWNIGFYVRINGLDMAENANLKNQLYPDEFEFTHIPGEKVRAIFEVTGRSKVEIEGREIEVPTLRKLSLEELRENRIIVLNDAFYRH